MVRLAEASARVRLSDRVEKQDAERAIRLLKTSLRDVVTDPETGRIDIDIITTGQTHSQVENMRKVLAIIKEKDKEMDMVPLKEVLDEAQALNIERGKAEEIIRKLGLPDGKNILYAPTWGHKYKKKLFPWESTEQFLDKIEKFCAKNKCNNI